MRPAVVLACALVLCLAARQASADPCKLTTTVGGETVNYDITILQRKASDGTGLHANWYASETHQDDPSVRDDYMYFFNMCGPLVGVPSNISPKIKYYQNDAAVLQKILDLSDDDDKLESDDEVGSDPDTSTDGFVLGVSATSQGLTRLMDGDLRYTFGPATTNITVNGKQVVTSRHCATKNTTVLFFCADVGLGAPVFAHEGQQCDYLFVWNTCAACPIGSDIRNACPKTANTCYVSSKMGGGAIFAIVLVVLVATYFLVGTLYNRFVNGAKGFEQIPNFEFWVACLGYTQLGCEYTLSCACLRKNKNKPKATAVKYQGLDDKMEDLDDDADDRLYDISH